MSKTFRTTPEVTSIINGRGVIEPPSYRKQWTSSRLVVMEDGTTVPLLYILAAHKFGAFDPKEKMPYWGDKMCTNESLDNVELLPMNPDRRPRQNSYGVPSGTPEYLKRYRAANKDKMKTYHQRYYRKMREVYEAALHAAPSTTPILDSQFSKLMEIIPKPPEEE